ncbi:SRPBCC family protein [Thermobifida halotolerans]|uniref:SRPBCC family protein n=1 Tax=Thermobifida halotolerans TaxID=483545 RepID=UPI000B1703B7|nr:SRPBCC family protein [Thermobifida halotolerans]
MVRNEHRRRLAAPPDAVGARSTPSPRRTTGCGPSGTGPRCASTVRYRVEEYRPGRRVRFRFEAPRGFDGHHEYVVVPAGERETVLRHSLVMRTTGPARLGWPLFYRPLHDALIEDSLDRTARSLDLDVARPRRWSPLVRALRAVARRAVPAA